MTALVGLFGILITAFIMSRRISFSANSYFNKLDENNYPFFITAQIIVPFVIGVSLLLIYFIPEIQITETYVWIGLAIIIIITTIRISNLDPIYFDEDEKKIEISWPIVCNFIYNSAIRPQNYI